MKKFLLFAMALLLLPLSNFAQNNIQLNIHHQLASAEFAMETPAQNNIGNDFEVTRLQYYISEISVTHDGGVETVIEDLWVLVDADETTEVDLGDHAIDVVEKISFHIGVDEAHNHLDPTTYPGSHPLAPQFPSMHWGWAPGYRFVAIEGYGGSSFNQLFQFHGLGDDNYFRTDLELTATAENNQIVIELDADYTRALEEIDVNSGNIVHGDYGDAKKCLENFRDYVFTPTGQVTSTVDISAINDFTVYPNPTTNGNITISVDATEDAVYQVAITDLLGRQIQFFNQINSNTAVEAQLNGSGLFFVQLIKEGQTVMTQKLISK